MLGTLLPISRGGGGRPVYPLVVGVFILVCEIGLEGFLVEDGGGDAFQDQFAVWGVQSIADAMPCGGEFESCHDEVCTDVVFGSSFPVPAGGLVFGGLFDSLPGFIGDLLHEGADFGGVIVVGVGCIGVVFSFWGHQVLEVCDFVYEDGEHFLLDFAGVIEEFLS